MRIIYIIFICILANANKIYSSQKYINNDIKIETIDKLKFGGIASLLTAVIFLPRQMIFGRFEFLAVFLNNFKYIEVPKVAVVFYLVYKFFENKVIKKQVDLKIEQLQIEKNNKIQELNQLKEQKEQFELEKNNKIQELEKKLKELSELKEELNKNNNELKKLKEQKEQLKIEKDNKIKDLEKKSKELNQFKEEIKQLQIEKNNNIQELEKQLEKNLKELNKNNEELSQLKEQKKQLEMEKKNKIEELEQLKIENNNKIKDLEKQLEEQSNKLSNKVGEFNQLQIENNNIKKTENQVAYDLSSLLEEVIYICPKNAANENKKINNKEKIEQLNNDNIDKNIKDIIDKNIKYKQKIMKLKDKIEELRPYESKYKAEIDSLNKLKKELSAEKFDFKNKYLELNKKQEAQNNLENLEIKDKKSNKVEAYKDEEIILLNNIIKELEKQINDLKKKPTPPGLPGANKTNILPPPGLPQKLPRANQSNNNKKIEFSNQVGEDKKIIQEGLQEKQIGDKQKVLSEEDNKEYETIEQQLTEFTEYKNEQFGEEVLIKSVEALKNINIDKYKQLYRSKNGQQSHIEFAAINKINKVFGLNKINKDFSSDYIKLGSYYLENKEAIEQGKEIDLMQGLEIFGICAKYLSDKNLEENIENNLFSALIQKYRNFHVLYEKKLEEFLNKEDKEALEVDNKLGNSSIVFNNMKDSNFDAMKIYFYGKFGAEFFDDFICLRNFVSNYLKNLDLIVYNKNIVDFNTSNKSDQNNRDKNILKKNFILNNPYYNIKEKNQTYIKYLSQDNIYTFFKTRIASYLKEIKNKDSAFKIPNENYFYIKKVIEKRGAAMNENVESDAELEEDSESSD